MRLLHTFNDDRKARALSSFLTQKGVSNQLDIDQVTDWGSSGYGDLICRIWIIDEDDLEAAHKHLNAYLDNPDAEQFRRLQPSRPDTHAPPSMRKPPSAEKKSPTRPPPRRVVRPPGVATFYLIAICTVLFIASVMARRPPEPYPSTIPPTPLFSSKVEKTLYYDYPESYVLIDKLIGAYGFEKVINPSRLPAEGRYLLQQFYRTPYWKGFYPKVIAFFQSPANVQLEAPLFEKEKQGELWRLITPIFLHADLFHLFFNMIWLLVLGKQMERRLGIPRFLSFIAITAILSNTAQYLMSGPNFIGFSGVLCAMIAFVWIRQKKAPWEGYQLMPATMRFITIFILALAGVQLVSFLLEIMGQTGLSLPIANTAHISGALAGYLLAQSKFFSWKMRG